MNNPNNLTDAELEVLKGLADDKTLKGIASELGRSRQAIELRWRRLKAKLGVRGYVGAAKFAWERGLACVAAFLICGCAVPERPAPVVQRAMAALPVSAPQTNSLLAWDGQQPFTVSTGPARGNYTNSFITTNNFVLLVANIAYEISNPSGLAFWPSNRHGRLVLTGYAEGMTNPTNIAVLLVFTNNPPGNMRFWGIEDQTIGWE